MAKLTYTGAEVQSLLDKVNGISGGGIAYPLSWSGYSSGVYDGSTPANIAIPSLLSQLANDVEFITSDSVNSLLTDYLPKSGGTVSGNITAQSVIANNGVDVIYNYLGGSDVTAADTTTHGTTLGYGSGDSFFWFFDTKFYSSLSATANRVQMAYGYERDRIKYRRYSGGWGDWKEVAFTDSNVASATKLATPCKIWGQSFNGTEDVSGVFTTTEDTIINTTKYINVDWTRGIVWCNDNEEYGNLCYASIGGEKWINIVHGAYNSVRGVRIYSNGNIAIGGATASEKLHVHGNITATTFLPTGDIAIQFPDGEYIDRWGNIVLSSTASHWSVNKGSDVLMKIDINGNLLATGEITQHSSLVLKDVVDTRFLTLKELSELKPYSFYWKDKRDDKLHAGAVADYVKPILPEVISTDKDDIHSMNYANAAWVVGTSLTPYVSKHEEEIERLKARVKYLESRLKER